MLKEPRNQMNNNVYKGNPYKQTAVILLMASEIQWQIYDRVMYTGQPRSKEVTLTEIDQVTECEFLHLSLILLFHWH